MRRGYQSRIALAVTDAVTEFLTGREALPQTQFEEGAMRRFGPDLPEDGALRTNWAFHDGGELLDLYDGSRLAEFRQEAYEGQVR